MCGTDKSPLSLCAIREEATECPVVRDPWAAGFSIGMQTRHKGTTEPARWYLASSG